MIIIELKKEGEYSTIFANNIVGDINKDKFIVAECVKKDGTDYAITVATDGIASITEREDKKL